MRKITKRIAAAAFAAVMLTGMTAVPVYAADSAITSATVADQDTMKQALTKVKQRITIPTELSVFSYSTSKQYGMTCYRFTWHTSDDSKEYRSMQVSIVGDTIISCTMPGNYNISGEPSFAKLTDEQILKKAKEYLKKLDPHVMDSVEMNISLISLKGETAAVNIQRVENGIKVSDNGGSITVNKNTGELISLNLAWWDDAKYPDPSKAISETAAQNAYRDMSTLTPYYTIYTDWETGKKTAYLVYRTDFNEALNAYTGEPSTYDEDRQADQGSWGYPFGAYAAYDDIVEETADCEEDAAANPATGVTFTEEELKEITADEGLLTDNQVLKLFTDDKYIALTGDYELTSRSTYKNEDTEQYYSNVRLSVPDKTTKNADGTTSVTESNEPTISATVNAKTGAVENLYSYGSAAEDTSKKYDLDKNKSVAEGALKHFLPELAKHYRSAPENDEAYSWVADGKTYYNQSKTFVFNRYANGVRVEGDYVNITVSNDGKVTGFNYNFTSINFPSVPKFDKNKAFETLFEQQDMELSYKSYVTKNGVVKTYLIYSTDAYTLDRNYKKCSYNGLTIEENTNNIKSYSDIKGITQEEAITTLLKYNVALSSKDGKFAPDDIITEQQFNKLLASVIYDYEVYPISVMFSTYSYIEQHEGRELTNINAAKLYTMAVGGQDIAQLKGIFKQVFTDVPLTDENAGYAAIAKGAGFMTGSGGKLDPDHKVTRAEAIQIIYDFIDKNSK
ncbi:MAG: S-layer homology domain-containing protein [Oscillospiraceae bacterium]